MTDNYTFSENPFPSSSNILTKGNNAHFQLCGLYRDFDQDELALKEFIQVVETDLHKLSAQIITAFRQNDLNLYQQIHYKTLTPLKMIQANTLQDLLAEGSDLMERTESNSDTATFDQLEMEFSAVLTSLAELV